MRFEPERSYNDNMGLDLPRDFLEPVKTLNPELSYADLWVLAGYEAVEMLGGPRITFRAGRIDATAGGANCPPSASAQAIRWSLVVSGPILRLACGYRSGCRCTTAAWRHSGGTLRGWR